MNKNKSHAQQLEDNEYFKQFDRDEYKLTEPIDELLRITTHNNLDKQRKIQNNIRIAREALDHSINLIKQNQHSILEKQRQLEQVNNNPELYEYLEHYRGKIDKSNYDGEYLIINEPHDKEEALRQYRDNPHSNTNEESIEHKINKKPIYAYYYNNIRSLNQIYNCLQRVYEIEN